MSTEENPYQAQILLGVWGESFIKQFLAMGLATLLAPGNVPALAQALPLTFVFLTRSEDVSVFEASSAFQKLKAICTVEFIYINDLIRSANHTTTLTYAYDRAVRQMGAEMLRTYFIFLTSDYLMADGSLQGLLRYIQKGYSGICAGNFQVAEEKMIRTLRKKMRNDVLQISPRELVKLSLSNLHAMTVASLINQEIINNYRANRFFIAEDELIAGRFYLLHMLCIKPETMDYQIGASCDYSFIPEMCPSGNVGIITDSDDYLVVEAQSSQRELNNIGWNPYQEKLLVRALSEWTTERHRMNAKTTIYYHSQDLTPAQKDKADKQLEVFIDKLGSRLNTIPAKPYRHHPYWLGAIRSFKSPLEKELLKTKDTAQFINYLAAEEHTLFRKLYLKFFGVPPRVHSWHYRWLEFKGLSKRFRSFITQSLGNTLVLYGDYHKDFIHYRNWLVAQYKNTSHFYLPRWLQKNDYKLDQYEQCIILIHSYGMKNLEQVFSRLKKQLPQQAKILVVIANTSAHRTPHFSEELLTGLQSMVVHRYKITNLDKVCSNVSLLGSRTIEQVTIRYPYSKRKRLLVYLALLFPAVFSFFFLNWCGRLFPGSGHCTHLLMTFTLHGSHSHE